MSGFRPLLSLVGMVALALGISAPAFASSVYTSYSIDSRYTIAAATCDSTGRCIGYGRLHGLNGPCSLLEGPATTHGDITRQQLYVLQTGSDSIPVVALKIYDKTVSTRPDDEYLRISLIRTIPLPSFRGGSKLTCAMAGNPTSLFLGVVGAGHAIQFDRKTLTGHTFGADPYLRSHFTSMVADQTGYVSVYFGGGAYASAYLFGPDGIVIDTGDPYSQVLLTNQNNGVSLK